MGTLGLNALRIIDRRVYVSVTCDAYHRTLHDAPEYPDIVAVSCAVLRPPLQVEVRSPA